MKTSTIIAATAATAILALGACSKSTPDNVSDSISFDKTEVQKSYRLIGTAEDFDTENDLSFGCQADLLMPTSLLGHDTKALRDSIFSAAFDTCGNATTEIIAASLRKAATESGYAIADTIMPDTLIKQEPSFLSRYDGFSSTEGYLESVTPRYLVYAITNSTYMPRAAHGMYTTRYINYDLVSGRVITLRELFTAEGLAKLPDLITAKASQMEGTIGRTEISSLPSNGNFYLNNSGEIVFAYQPYEVASYAQGEVQIPIQAYMLSEILSPFGNDFLLGSR